MNFDIRTFDTAYYSLLDLLQMTGQEFVEEYYINCEADFTQLWDRHFTQLDQIDISHISPLRRVHRFRDIQVNLHI